MAGVKFGAWVSVGDCPIEFNVCGDRVEFQFGGTTNGFDMVFTESGLERMIAKGSEALGVLRAEREPLERETL